MKRLLNDVGTYFYTKVYEIQMCEDIFDYGKILHIYTFWSLKKNSREKINQNISNLMVYLQKRIPRNEFVLHLWTPLD